MPDFAAVPAPSPGRTTCSWGDGHAFEDWKAPEAGAAGPEAGRDEAARTSLLPGISSPPVSQEQSVDVDAGEYEEMLSEDLLVLRAAEVLKNRAASGGSSPCSRKCNDDGKSTISTTVSGTSLLSPRSLNQSASSLFADTICSDNILFERPSSIMNFAKTIDPRFARIYEKRIQAQVKSDQKAAMKRASMKRAWR